MHSNTWRLALLAGALTSAGPTLAADSNDWTFSSLELVMNVGSLLILRIKHVVTIN